MVSDARICIRRAELSDARIRSRKLEAKIEPDAREQDRYQTRGY